MIPEDTVTQDMFTKCPDVKYNMSAEALTAAVERSFDPSKSDIIQFYRGHVANKAHQRIYEIWSFSNGQFEMEHDYIQWLFASNEASMMNCDAPILTKEEAEYFQKDQQLKDTLKYSLTKIMAFMGFRIIESGGVPVIEPEPGVSGEHQRKWLTHFNHNFLRVTRIMKSLRLLGLQEYALAFYDALRPYKQNVSMNTYECWTKAIFDPLWKT